MKLPKFKLSLSLSFFLSATFYHWFLRNNNEEKILDFLTFYHSILSSLHYAYRSWLALFIYFFHICSKSERKHEKLFNNY